MAIHPDPRKGPVDRTPPTGRLTVTPGGSVRRRSTAEITRDEAPRARSVGGVSDDGWGGDALYETERLVLRPYRRADLDAFAAMNLDPDVMRYLGGPQSRDVTEAKMLAANADVRAGGTAMVAVERKEDGAFLGAVGLSVVPWYPDQLQLGWRLGPVHWGKGYATEAAERWLAHGFEVEGRDEIHAMADVPNRASRAVMERLGMRWVHDADHDDGDEPFRAALYVIRRGEWRARTV